MEEITGILQNPTTVEQVQQANRQLPQGGVTQEAGDTNTTVSDTVTISDDGLQLSQSVGQVQPTEDGGEAGDQQGSVLNNDSSESTVFLDIRV